MTRPRPDPPGADPGRSAAPRRLARLAAATLVVLAALVAGGGHGAVSRPGPTAAQAADPPATVVLTLPAPSSPCTNQFPCLRNTAVLRATVTTAAGRTITSVQFQRSAPGADDWVTIATDTTSPYQGNFFTTLVPNDIYDLRARVTVAPLSPGAAPDLVASAVARDRLVANGFSPATLTDPGSPLAGTVPLAAAIGAVTDGTAIVFQQSPAGTNTWTTIDTDTTPTTASGKPPAFGVSFDTTTVPDGHYDLRALPVDLDSDDPTGTTHSAVPVRDRIIDNTAPVAALATPAGPLSAIATLHATADDAGSGLASVRFERAIAGTGNWVTIGARIHAPFDESFDTRGVPDGRYDLRVVATDRAGNTTTSAVVGDVAIANPGQTAPPAQSIQNVVTPADGVTLLGTIAGSAQHETWAYGITSAPPAVVDGSRLEYTAPGKQLVLLRYTDDGGWEIADVLRDADGVHPYPLDADDPLPPTVTGQMTPSGEAWIALTRTPAAGGGPDVTAMFHRPPGGRFREDPAAEQALGPLLSNGILPLGQDAGEVRLGQTDDGAVYGVLAVPTQPAQSASLTPAGGGAAVSVQESLDYGVLKDGSWTKHTAPVPSTYNPTNGDALTLTRADPTAPGAGWATVSVSGGNGPLLLGRFDSDDWHFATTGLDALDLTELFRGAGVGVIPTGLRADGDAVWFSARVGTGTIVGRYDGSDDELTSSWCSALPKTSRGCGGPLGLATVPDAFFDTPEGRVGVALQQNAVNLFEHGEWTRTTAPGYGSVSAAENHGRALFTGPRDGWLAGANALGKLSATTPAARLALWPQANRAPLTSVVLPPGSDGDTRTSGALAVGLNGTALRYDAAAGWLIEPLPSRAQHLGLRAVAFDGPNHAFAVGQAGVILRWDGVSWSEDPQSVQITQTELTALAFRPSGEGWAVGRNGTILHFDGSSWSVEHPPPEDDGLHLTSVAVAGSDVFAVIGGNLIQRDSDGTWHRAPASLLPTDPAPVAGNLRLVSGLPDGGAVVAGRSVVLVRNGPSEPFQYSTQPVEGIAVALSAFRPGPAQDVRAFVSVAPPALQSNDVGAYPPGDGELLRQTDSGWDDLSNGQYAGSEAPADGVVKVDPVLSVATSPDGEHAWVAGGFVGTLTAAGLGTFDPLAARPVNWQTASLWRYDRAGSVASPAVTPATVRLPATPHTVNFAFFSSAVCKSDCDGTLDAQPDVNLRAAATQISQFAAQPGGPAFAVLGGNAHGQNPDDIAKLPTLLSPLGTLPLYAAYGPLDAVPGLPEPGQPWADAFAGAPAPFGPGATPDGITPLSSGSPLGTLHRYYAFDAEQSGGRLRVVVLDNSAGTLEGSAPGQTDWLRGVLSSAQDAGIPVVVIAPRALRTGGATDGSETASLLVGTTVLAVFTPSPDTSINPDRSPKELNERRLVPERGGRVPEYEAASLGYQETANNGVVWYSVSVNSDTQTIDVKAIPIVDSLALKPLLGLSVARSSTLAFEAVGRRPLGTLPPTIGGSTSGIDNYVDIPAPDCGTRPCVPPSYAFTSSDPTIGDFVVPSGQGSRFPLLDANGHPIPSSVSGLFCGFNSGTTTVSVTTGLLSSSLPVTVKAGGIGRPCGTVFRAGVNPIVLVPRARTQQRTAAPPGASVPPATPPANTTVGGAIPSVVPALLPPLAPAPPAPHLAPPPPPFAPVPPQPQPPPFVSVVPSFPAVSVPPIPSAAQPVPPGGSATAQAAARRKEKARKHASQSAFTTRPSDVAGADWFYGVVGVASVLTMLLVAGGMRPDPRLRPARVESHMPRRPPWQT